MVQTAFLTCAAPPLSLRTSTVRCSSWSIGQPLLSRAFPPAGATGFALLAVACEVTAAVVFVCVGSGAGGGGGGVFCCCCCCCCCCGCGCGCWFCPLTDAASDLVAAAPSSVAYPRLVRAVVVGVVFVVFIAAGLRRLATSMPCFRVFPPPAAPPALRNRLEKEPPPPPVTSAAAPPPRRPPAAAAAAAAAAPIVVGDTLVIAPPPLPLAMAHVRRLLAEPSIHPPPPHPAPLFSQKCFDENDPAAAPSAPRSSRAAPRARDDMPTRHARVYTLSLLTPRPPLSHECKGRARAIDNDGEKSC
jgi:hypothetical protein